MAKVKLLVSVKDDHLPRFSEVVKQLKNKGLDVDQALESAGVVTGSADADKVQELRGVGGIANIEHSRDIQIAPPDSKIQ